MSFKVWLKHYVESLSTRYSRITWPHALPGLLALHVHKHSFPHVVTESSVLSAGKLMFKTKQKSSTLIVMIFVGKQVNLYPHFSIFVISVMFGL